MCDQLGIPFQEFFFATLIGKTIIPIHIQVCHHPWSLDVIKKIIVLCTWLLKATFYLLRA
jgi:hypothetical protein